VTNVSFVFVSLPNLRGFSMTAEFARVPIVGDYLFLYPSDEQRTLIGSDFVASSAIPCLVRDVVLRPQEDNNQQYVADLFVVPVSADEWNRKYAASGGGDVEP